MNLMLLTASVSDAIASISQIAENVGKVNTYDIAFPHLNIFIYNLRNNFSVFGYTIAYYGVIIALAMLIGFMVVILLAKKTNQNQDNYYDLFIWVIITSIIGARAYYVIFNWDYYQIRPKQVLDIYQAINIRAGGLAIYGGIIAAILTTFIFCLIKRMKFFKTIDTAICGLAIGQAIGRFGNFFNMEAFGTWTNNIFAMRMKYNMVDRASIDNQMLYNIINDNGVEYVQAHPTFLYESFFNILLFILLIVLFTKLKKFNGQVFATYLLGYGVVRFFIEGLRTDSLYIANTIIRVSQVVSLVCIFVGLVIYIYNLSPLKKIIVFPEIVLPEIKLPKIKLPKIKLPDIKFFNKGNSNNDSESTE